jgi:hypothetical protein
MKKLVLILFAIVFLNTLYTNAQCIQLDKIDILHYEINLDISDIESESIQGYTEITFKPIIENLDIVYFDLLMLSIDSIVNQDFQISEYSHNDTLITVILEEALISGESYKIKIYYQGQPVMDPSGWGGFYFENGYAFNLGVGFEAQPHNFGRVWFPCIDDFKDRATYNFIITTDINHTAVCGGELIDVITDEDNQKATYYWELNDPIPTYLASVAVGNYELISDIYEGVNGEIPINYYVQPGMTNQANNSFVNMHDVLEIFEEKFGPYRWNKVGFVTVPHVFGAMEHATNVTISSAFVNGTLTYEDLLYHELSHSWFGNLATCANSGDMWLNEGWAKYCESIYREFHYSRENMLAFRRSAHNTVLRYYHIQDGGFFPLYGVPPELTYSRTIYEKGASVAHSIRGYIADDDVFFDAITEHLNQNEFSDVHSYMFRDFLTNYTGIDFTDFFDAQVFSEGFVHYSIDSCNIVQAGAEYEATVYMKQKLRGRSEFANSNRIEISFIDENFNDYTVMCEFDGEFGTNTFTVPFEPILVLCDYFEKFSDATIDETKILNSTGTNHYSNMYFRAIVNTVDAENPALLRVTHNWAAPDDFIEDISGLVIANHRYWTVEGNFPDGFKTDGTFYYHNSQTGSSMYGHLDNEFINVPTDSIRLVYRPDRASNWQIIEDYTISGIFRTIKIDSLMPGEYSLAKFKWDSYVSNQNTMMPQSVINIYPNPSNGIFNIEKQNCEFIDSNLEIYNLSGQMIYSQTLSGKYVSVDLSNISAAIYHVRIQDNRNIINKKIIIQ